MFYGVGREAETEWHVKSSHAKNSSSKKVVLREIILYYKMVLVYTMPRLILAVMHCKASMEQFHFWLKGNWTSSLWKDIEVRKWSIPHILMEVLYVIHTKQSSTF